MRYNEYRAAQINGRAAPGYSSGQAMKALEEVFAQTMPREMGFDYIGHVVPGAESAQGVPPAVIFGFSLLFVFLILAALYESWSLPFSVLLSTPVAVFGAYLRAVGAAPLRERCVRADRSRHADRPRREERHSDRRVRQGEFERGKSIADAALDGARIRLRPILMTAFAFILGCVPLWIATGSGAVSRRIMGTVVIGGMLAASLIADFPHPGHVRCCRGTCTARHAPQVAAADKGRMPA